MKRALAWTGAAVLGVTLAGPLDILADRRLFSAHAIQFLALTMVAPPLLLAGIDPKQLTAAIRHPLVARFTAVITRAPAAFVAFAIVVVGWHLPMLHDAAMRHPSLMVLEHASFLGAGIVMWWPILGLLPGLPRLGDPAQVLYALLLTLPIGMLSLFITYADTLLYPGYAADPPAWALSPLEDQQLGGILMWLPSALVLLGVMSMAFLRWARAAERDEPHRESRIGVDRR